MAFDIKTGEDDQMVACVLELHLQDSTEVETVSVFTLGPVFNPDSRQHIGRLVKC